MRYYYYDIQLSTAMWVVSLILIGSALFDKKGNALQWKSLVSQMELNTTQYTKRQIILTCLYTLCIPIIFSVQLSQGARWIIDEYHNTLRSRHIIPNQSLFFCMTFSLLFCVPTRDIDKAVQFTYIFNADENYNPISAQWWRWPNRCHCSQWIQCIFKNFVEMMQSKFLCPRKHAPKLN